MSATSQGAAQSEPAWVAEVIDFWFVEQGQSKWFVKDEAADAKIRERFLALHERLIAAGEVDFPTPRQALASVIVLDQFSRNMFRGNARAFAADALALRISNAAIDAGADTNMSTWERLFLYMPFEHSESVADQKRSIALIETLGNENLMRYALAHKAIIDQFGRFPHRNEVLGRVSSAAEIEMMKQPMGSF